MRLWAPARLARLALLGAALAAAGILAAPPAAMAQQSSDANLASIAFTDNDGGTLLTTLSPAFAAATTSYTLSVSAGAPDGEVTFAPTANDAGASFAISPADANASKNGHQVDVGTSNATVTVTAADSTTKAYAFDVRYDYDDDNDGYIDVRTRAQLSAIRDDLNSNGDQSGISAFPHALSGSGGARFGCPSSGCVGYELRADIDLRPGGNWTPIGGNRIWHRFTGKLRGNGHVISNMTIGSGGTVGLLQRIGSGGVVEGVGLLDVSINGGPDVGAVAGNSAGVIRNVYATGTINANVAGGLVGWHTGTIRASWTDVAVTGSTRTGGMVGYDDHGGSIHASYSIGPVSQATSEGLVGQDAGSGENVSTSYHDAMATGVGTAGTGRARSTSDLQSPTAYGSTGIYSAWDDQDIDGDGTNDDAWDFGTSSQYPVLKAGGHSAATQFALQSPDLTDVTLTIGATQLTLSPAFAAGTTRYTAAGSGTQVTVAVTKDHAGAGVAYKDASDGALTDANGGVAGFQVALSGTTTFKVVVTAANGVQTKTYEFTVSPPVDYDDDNDGYIDVRNAAQLSAMRHDLDTDGNATHADWLAAFPSPAAGMGCAPGDHDGNSGTPDRPFCKGYELRSAIVLDVVGSNQTNWTPIGTSSAPFTGYFTGNGLTISNLSARVASDAGLFGVTRGTVERVGVIDAFVRTSSGDRGGALAGTNNGTIRFAFSTGSVSLAGQDAGGLVGCNCAHGTGGNRVVGSIYASWSTASAVAGAHSAGGLVGENGGTITASYAAGLAQGYRSGSPWHGGLVGHNLSGATVTASYALGAAALIGEQAGTATASLHGSAVSLSILAYTGVYQTWDDHDTDGNGTADAPWNFGDAQEYPYLRLGFTQAEQTRQRNALNRKLSGLTLRYAGGGPVALSPAFSALTTSYTATIRSGGTRTLVVTPSVPAGSASVSMGGDKLTGGVAEIAATQSGTTATITASAVNQLSSIAALGTVAYTITVSHADGAPIAPRNLAATPHATVNGRVDLSWSADSAVNGYEICTKPGTSVCAAGDTTWAAISGSGASTASHMATGLEGTTEYTFSLRATDSSNRKGEISSVTATTNPHNLVPSFAQTTGSVTWTRGKAVAPYTVNAATGGDGTLSYSAAFSPSASGLSFNASMLQISGTPTHTASTVTATVTVRDDEGTPSDMSDDDTATFTLTITLEDDSTPSFASTSGSASFTIGKANITVRVHQLPALTGGNGALSYTDTLPTGLVYTSRGTMDTHGGTVNATSGNTLTAGTATYEIRATDRDGSAATYRLTATVETDQTPSYAGANALADRTFIKDTAISSSVAPAGGNAPVECAIASGTLPSNVTLTGCLLTGTPNVVLAHPSSATIRATDRDGSTALSASFTMTVTANLTPSFSPNTGSAAFTIGRANTTAYPVPVATGGDGTLTYAVDSTTPLPSGLTYSAATSGNGGTINATDGNTLTTANSGTYNIIATDSNGDTATLALTVTIENDVSPTAASGSTTYAIGQAKASGREFTVPALGGNAPVTYAYVAGATTATQLPSGMSFDPADRKIKGTPPSGLADGSSRTITIRGTDRDGQAADYTLTLSFETNVTPSFSPNTGSRTFTIGRANTTANAFQLPAVSGNGTIRYAVSSTTPLPSGLVYTAPGPSDSHGGTVNADAGNTLSASDAGNYAITATDDEGESSTFTLTVAIETDAQTAFAQSNGSASYTIGRANTAANEFQAPAASAGNAPVTYAYVAGASAATQLPAALSFDPADRKIKGTPGSSLTAGSRTITIRATDRDGQTADFTLTLTLQADLTPSFSPDNTGSAAYVIGQANAAASQFTVPAATGGNAPYAYAYVAGATTGTQLPSGLSFDPADRKIKGTVASSGLTAGESRTVTIRASDRDNSTADFTLTLTLQANSTPSYAGVNAPPNRTFSQNKAIQAFSVAPAGGNAPACSITSGTLPNGLVISGCQISGTPDTIVSAASITITATDLDGETATASFSITVQANEVPSFSPNTASAAFTIGRANTTPYPVPVATGGDGTLTYAVDSATPLPSGLTYGAASSGNGGTINATAGNTLTTANSGTYNIIATDSNGDTATLALAVTIEANQTPSWAQTSGSAAFTIGRANASAFPLPRATGGNGTPLSYAVDSTTPLPSGLVYSPPGSMDTHGGTVNATSGNTLTASDAGNYTIRATDRDGSAANYTLTVTVETNDAPSYANANALPDRTFSQNKPAAAFSVAPSGGNAPVTCAISSGTLPNGLVISGCQISGTPDTLTAAPVSITILATDRDNETASDTFTITVQENLTPSFSPNTASVTFTIRRPSVTPYPVPTATGGDGTLTYAVDSATPLPTGLAYGAASSGNGGTINTVVVNVGNTLTAGTTTYNIIATDSNGDTATLALAVTLEANLAPSWAQTSGSAAFTIGRANLAAHAHTLPRATGGNGTPLSYAVDSTTPMPSGLVYSPPRTGPGQMDTHGGTVNATSGNTLTTANSGTYTITATDRDGSAANYTLTVTVEANSAPSYANANALPDRTFSQNKPATAFSVAPSGGNAPVTCAITSGTLPNGLAISGCQISGTPDTIASAASITITATDRDGQTASDAFTITIVANQVPSFSPNTASATWTRNRPIAAHTVAAASGGDGTLSYSASFSPSASGLAFDATMLRITGTPTHAGNTVTATITVRDDEGTPSDTSDDDTATFTLTITLEANAAGPSFGTASVTEKTYVAGYASHPSITLPAADSTVAWNGDLTYSVSTNRAGGTLPAGITYAAATSGNGGTISIGSGTSATPRFRVTLTARDRDGSSAAIFFYVTVEADETPSWGAVAAPNQTVVELQTMTSATLPGLPSATAGNAPVTYSIASLPSWLAFDGPTRVLSATAPAPVNNTNADAVTNLVLKATDANAEAADLAFSVAVQNDTRLPSFSPNTGSAAYTIGRANSDYALFQIPAVTGGNAPVTYAVQGTALPSGLSLRSSDRRVVGTPGSSLAAGSADYVIRATDADNDTTDFTLTLALEANRIGSCGYTGRLSVDILRNADIEFILPVAEFGNQPLPPDGSTSDARLSGSFTPVPAGLSLLHRRDPTTGYTTALGIAGNTATAGGGSNGLIDWTDRDDNASVDCDLTFALTGTDTQPAFGSASQPTLTLIRNETYAAGDITALAAATGGQGPLHYTASALPAGLSLNFHTRELSGAPTALTPSSGARVTLRARDTDGDPDTLQFTVNVVGGVTLSSTSLAINEANAPVTETYTVALASQPSGNVVVAPSVTACSGCGVTVSPSSLTFTRTNWSAPKTVTVRVAADADGDDETATITHTVTGGNYAGVAAPSVAVSVTDDDSPRIVVPSSLSVAEGASASYSVRLSIPPTSGETVTVTPTFPSGLTRTDSTALTFTSANYSTTKTVTFTADSDGDVSDASLTISHAASSGVSGSQYAGLTANVVVAVDDDDYVGVVSDPTSLTILEQSAGKPYAVRLGSQPSANVTLTPSGTGLSFNPSSLSFTMSNWGTTQNVTVTVDDDANTITETRTVTHTAASTDANYNASFTNGDVTVTATDNDSPSVVVNPTSLTIAEQSSKTYALSLATQPSANVVITVSVTNNSDVTVNSSTFTFTTINYGTAQNVTVSVADDPDAQNESATISHSAASADTGYHGIAINGVSVTVTDNDEDGINLRNAADDADITTLAVTEGQTAQYRVELTAQPTAGVTITPSATGLSFNPSSVSFTTSNWSAAKLITVTPANDLDGRDESVTVSHVGSASGGYNALTLDDLTVTVTDDDPTGPLVANASGVAITAITVAEGATSDNTYRLSLSTAPSSNVTVALTKASGDSADVTFAPSSVVFTPGAPQAGDPSGAARWNSPQTITISAAQDDDARNDDAATITHTTSVASGGDSDYANQTADLAVTITDDDSPGLVVSATSIGVIEGSTQTYSLKLASEPSADVAVTPQCTAAAPSCAGLTFSGGASGVFTFTTGNWDTTQEVTVSATDNNAADGARSATITHAVSSLDSMNDPADAQYNGVAFASANVRADVTDDDAPGVTVNPTSVSVEEEDATGASYSVRLATQPSANVVIAVSTNNSDVTFTPSTLTFTPSGAGIWSSAQSVTVKANSDPDAQDETGALSHRASSSDSNYNGIAISGVSVAVTDNDEDGVDVSDPSGANPSISVNEQGSATYQVKLTAQPTGNVRVTPSISAGAPLRVSPSSATFTRTNWNSAKTFTVRADDDRDSDNETATISHGASGAGYGGSETRESLAVTIMDNDLPGLRFTAPNGRTLTTLALAEGRAGSYRIALNTQPSGNVTVTPSAAGVVVSGGGGSGNNEFAFTPTNYSSPRTVTVTPASDGDDDDEPQANLAHAFASTVATDPYHQLAGVTLAFTVDDDDFVGLRAAPSSLNVTEESTSGDGRTYALSLGSQPSANVTVTPSGARLSFNPSSVTFTNGNWDTPRNVTVSVAADANAVNETLTVSHSTGASGDAEYANKSGADSGFTDARVRVVAVDDDRPAVTEIVFWGMPSARAVADTYVRGAAITVQARFSRPVTVTGTPRIALRIGGATRYASYARTRTGGTRLDFRYQVQESDVDATNGVGVPRDALQLNGGSIRHTVSASVGADLRSAAVPDDPTRKVNGRLTPAPSATTPNIRSTPPTASGEYGYGETIEFRVGFDIPFRLDDSDGKPRLRLTLGAQTRYAEYDRTEGNGLFFAYVVRSSDSAPSGAALPQNALELNGARIVNAYDDSADANLTLPRLNADSAHKVDGTTSSLQSLAVSPGTLSPAFAAPPADASAYRVEVGNSVASATITAAPKFGAAALAYSTTDADPASGHQVGLEVGENRFDVTVTGRTTIARRYAVTFRREGASNADLRALSVSDPTLRLYAPRAMRHGYDPRETEYTLDVGRDVASVTLVVVKSDSGASASVSLRGESLAVDAMGEVTIPLEHGDNPVSISVTSRNPTTKTYAVNVMRAGLPVRLASLTLGGGALVKSGGDGRIGFDPSHFEYTASVINRVSSITVTPSAESGSRITVNGAAIRSGDRSRAIRLAVGSNSIVVSVTNDEPGAITGTYRIAVTRGRAPAPAFSPAPSAPIPTATPTPTPTASPTPAPTASPTPDPAAPPTPAPTASPTPDPAASPTPDPAASPTPDPAASPTPDPAASPTPDPAASPTPDPTASPSPDPTASPSPDPAASPTPAPAATPPPAPTATPMPAPTATPMPAPTATPMPAPTATATPVMPPPAPGATLEPPVAPAPTAGYSLAFWLAVGGAAVVIVAGFAGGALVIARRR